MALSYRPEIDGLRALAVLPVIAFHAGSGMLGGGYAGVDVFFVISGYLITSILVRELGAGTYSLGDFYARRARRILPALFLVCAASTAAAFVLMTPQHLRDFGESLLATLVFLSNVHFWRESGYFAEASELKPLLHTWSLAIEEQFYILFPLALAAVWRLWRRGLVALVGAAWLVSLAIAVWASRAEPDANFYLLPGRAFELATGALVALLPALPFKGGWWRSLAAGLGLGLIAFAVTAFDADTPFPGPATLVPVIGTALVIAFARADEPVGRVLSMPLLVWIGLLSYSAYLWHWPLFVFARLWHFQGGPEPHYPILVALTFLLSWLSWRFVETPFRRPSVVPARLAVRTLAAPAAAFVLVGTVTAATGGLAAARTSPGVAALEASATFSPMRERCHTRGRDYRPPEEACTYFGDPPGWAVFGDSHTVELGYALARALEPRGEALSHHSFSNCPPMSGREGERSDCARWTEETLEHLAGEPEIHTVIVTYRIHNYLWGDHAAHYPALPARFSEAHRTAVWAAYLDALARLEAAGKRVVLVLQPPELPAPVSYMVRRAPGADGAIDGISRAWWEARRDWVMARLDDVPGGVAVVDPTPLFCDARTCRASEGEVFLYFDQNHLSLAGQERVAAAILEAVDQGRFRPN